jgi:hypothetical protein
MPRERRKRRRRGSSDGGSSLLGQVVGPSAGLAGNLFGDIRDAVMGMPIGLVHLAKDPIGSGEQIAAATWHTWSPLFAGDFQKFGKQLYDHPLAPILDVASVFTLGAGSVARGASGLSKAGIGGSKMKAVAALRGPKAPRKLHDPMGTREVLDWHPSERAGRFALQQLRLGIEAHMPQWYAKPQQKMRYETAFVRKMAGRTVAKSMVLSQLLEAGRLLSDESVAPAQRQKLMAQAHLGMIHHGIEVTAEEAKRLRADKPGGHYRFTKAPQYANGDFTARVKRLERVERGWDKRRVESAELSHALPQIERELVEANEHLVQLTQQGARIAMPTSTKRTPTQRQLIEMEAGPMIDATRRVSDLEERLLKARQARGIHDDAVAKIDDFRTQRMDIEERSFREYYAHAGKSAEAFEKAAHNFGRWATTRDPALAAVTREGKYVVVPKHDAYNLGLEMENSTAFVRNIYHRPTQLWKMAMIGWTPRAITNNTVGNWTLYALREGPSHESLRALKDAIEWQFGKRRAKEAFDEAHSFRKNDLIYREFGDVIGDVFGQEIMAGAVGARTKAGRIARRGLYGIVHAVADQPVRVASLHRYLRESPEVRALMTGGRSYQQAVRLAIKRNPALRERAVDHVRKTAGDYSALRTWEKHARQIIPFYLWYRHIARTTGNMALDTPARMAVMQRLSALGIEDTRELLGEIPEFLNGAVPLSAIGLGKGPESGRADIMLTASLNPFASIGEISTLVESLTTGSGPRGLGGALMGVNPFLTGIVEAASGTSLLSGAKIENTGGLIPTVLSRTAKGIPQYRIAEALFQEDTTTSESGSELLFARDDRGPLTSLFGIPLRNTSLATGEKLAGLEAGAKPAERRSRRKRRRR